MAANQVIVVGGGLAGLTAAHTIVEGGGSVVLLDKSAFCGGNSTKATSGINGALTIPQQELGNPSGDSVKIFESDCNTSFHGGKKGQPVSPLIKTLTHESAPALNWLVDKFNLDLSVVGFMGGASKPRCHRGKEKFPGMTITYALLEELEAIAKKDSKRAQIVQKARVVQLLKDEAGGVAGCIYEKGGQKIELRGPVILCTGGFGADFSEDSLLAKYKPELMNLSTTNGKHCTGDGCKLANGVGADLVDMSNIQVHPTGMVNPAEPDAKIKFLAAEALRGTGAIVLDANGKRFCNELGTRNYVTGEMMKAKGPFRLILNKKCSQEIHWHCKHYTGRGLMKHYKSGAELAVAIGCDKETLSNTFSTFNTVYDTKTCPFGKTTGWKNGPWFPEDEFYAAIITPLIHYTMGGIKINEVGEAMSGNTVIPGLYAAGEVAGAVHGINRLGGNSLLDCVVYGRVAGRACCKHLVSSYLGEGAKRLATIQSQLAPTAGGAAAGGAAAAGATGPGGLKRYTLAEVAAHNKEQDVWVIVGKQVLDVTKFMPDHPGGPKAIMLFAGRDATEEFDMLHKRDVIEKYAPESIIGTIA